MKPTVEYKERGGADSTRLGVWSQIKRIITLPQKELTALLGQSQQVFY